MARTDTGCIFGRLVQIGPRHAYIQRQGVGHRTRVPSERVVAWPPAPPAAPTKKARRK